MHYSSVMNQELQLLFSMKYITNHDTCTFALVRSDPRPQKVPPPMLVPPTRSYCVSERTWNNRNKTTLKKRLLKTVTKINGIVLQWSMETVSVILQSRLSTASRYPVTFVNDLIQFYYHLCRPPVQPLHSPLKYYTIKILLYQSKGRQKTQT